MSDAGDGGGVLPPHVLAALRAAEPVLRRSARGAGPHAERARAALELVRAALPEEATTDPHAAHLVAVRLAVLKLQSGMAPARVRDELAAQFGRYMPEGSARARAARAVAAARRELGWDAPRP